MADDDVVLVDTQHGPEQRDDAAAPATAAENIPESGAGARPDIDLVLVDLTEQLRAFHTRSQVREQVIEQLQQELERKRGGEEKLLLRPVVTDLQRLRGDLLHQARTLPEELDRHQIAELLESFALSAELSLERCGSVPVRPAVGTPFSTREHTAVRIVPATHPDDDGLIDIVLADGYLDTGTGRTTVPARVQVRRWQENDNSIRREHDGDA
jgi:hypothetical protein